MVDSVSGRSRYARPGRSPSTLFSRPARAAEHAARCVRRVSSSVATAAIRKSISSAANVLSVLPASVFVRALRCSAARKVARGRCARRLARAVWPRARSSAGCVPIFVSTARSFFCRSAAGSRDRSSTKPGAPAAAPASHRVRRGRSMSAGRPDRPSGLRDLPARSSVVPGGTIGVLAGRSGSPAPSARLGGAGT